MARDLVSVRAERERAQIHQQTTVLFPRASTQTGLKLSHTESQLYTAKHYSGVRDMRQVPLLKCKDRCSRVNQSHKYCHLRNVFALHAGLGSNPFTT